MFKELDETNLERYSRQILLREWGPEGQKRVHDSSVLIVGAGGLASAAALFLAGAGVGTLGILDPDNVSLSNLHRQIMHTTQFLGLPKVNSAKHQLSLINPQTHIQTYPFKLDVNNAPELFSRYDLILEATDNFAAKYLVNDAAHLVKKPAVLGAALGLSGQFLSIRPYAGPCYRCLFPQVPPPDTAPTCSSEGVMGPLVGIISSHQALEALRVILDWPTKTHGKLFTFDAWENSSNSYTFTPDPKCPACSQELSPALLKTLNPIYPHESCT